jgi:hypothetical protein
MNTTQTQTLATATKVGNEWSSNELATMNKMKLEGASVASIALALGRSYYGVSSKLSLAGFTTPRATKPAKQEVACDSCWLIHRGECA